MVFEGKNKAYGAYEMRQTSPSRHNKATIIVMIFVLIAFSLPALLKIVVPKQEKEVMTEVTELTNLEAPEEKTEEISKVPTISTVRTSQTSARWLRNL